MDSSLRFSIFFANLSLITFDLLLWTNLATMPEGGSDGPSLHLPDLLNSNHTTPDMFTYFSNSRESRN